MKLTTLAAAVTLSVLSLASLNSFAEGKADSVDYFAKDKHQKSSYSYEATSNSSQKSTGANGVVSKVNTSLGMVFANAQGMTLYTFTKDGESVSNCYDGCAGSWPPFLAKADAKIWGDFTVIERKDGTYQWAYKNQPLYTWVGDRQSGDTTGHGVGSVWFAAQP
ncbi:hypothetical protein BTA51_04885 [Hahella sp. CCB-MM4]|uniref:COG4315 family predicted lipoprotein n=1 Tax=Hahella sp. (strain CCB-MM4) TaxID=1926491 RepID=UPI000B9B2DE6|nr:hypothetical protein [Hahella sp. CCB-MM4]OZG74350.1 hypothetical protein BTA51_04885 [Hahella sp. CCB-MM4]